MKKTTAIILVTLGAFGLASTASSGQANLTRFGPEVIEHGRGGPAPTSYSAEFKAVEGPGKLLLQDFGITDAQIRVNEVAVAIPNGFRGNGEIVVPLQLGEDNTIEVSGVSGPGKRGGRLGLRVTQFTESDINVRAKMYFGVNTSDIFAQRNFYNTLGLVGDIFPAGPEQCRSFARSLGFADDYLIYVALTSFTGAPPWVDTVQFREDSFRSDAPYANLNHIGMAYATYSTTDLDGDYVFLKEQGVNFVSPPAKSPNGERFVFFKDQDGTFLKLVEESGDRTDGPNLTRLVNTNMNVADLERSREFYSLLGFTEEKPASQRGSGPFARAHGFKGPIAFEGMDLSLPGTAIPLPFGGDDEATLQLRQWKAPFDGSPPYSPPVNHLGIDRIAFYVDDLNATIDEMNRLGFEQLGPVGGGGGGIGSIGIVFFFDPDGIKVEFWGPISELNPNSDC